MCLSKAFSFFEDLTAMELGPPFCVVVGRAVKSAEKRDDAGQGAEERQEKWTASQTVGSPFGVQVTRWGR